MSDDPRPKQHKMKVGPIQWNNAWDPIRTGETIQEVVGCRAPSHIYYHSKGERCPVGCPVCAAATEQPAPQGEGTDVILDLVEVLGTGEDRDEPLPDDATTLLSLCEIACESLGWDLVEALLARRQAGIERYGTPLRTHNGRDARVDQAQELLDALVYCWQGWLESGTPPASDPPGGDHAR